MRRYLPLVLLGVLGCSLPVNIRLFSRPEPTATSVPATPTAPVVDEPLGSAENPVVLALPPSTIQPQPDVIQAGNVLTSLLAKTTGYKFVSVIPPGELELVGAFRLGNAHIASLSPFAYLLASQEGEAEAALAREQDGSIFYGTQFIARADADYTAYYDPIQDKNLAEADVALAQFKDKKPCWTDPLSPSGYVVPLGYLAEADVPTREPAFLASHPAVVRAVYAGGICDFGATYVDARSYPGLEDVLPDATKKIAVIWRVPPVIPYETVVFARSMPVEMRRLLIRAFVDLMATDEGKAAMQTLYGFTAMQVVQDSQYADFRAAVKASGLDLTTLIK